MNSDTQQTTTGLEVLQPKADQAAVPVWLIPLLLLALYWGMYYFDQHGGWFNRDVYAPYKSFAELQQLQPVAGGDECFVKGKQLFSLTCAVCHMETGVGNPANGCPPLVGSEWLSTPGVGRATRIVSKGLVGPIEVKGQVYNTGTMLPIGDQMPGSELEKSANIAAILCYVRKAFANNSVPVTADKVMAIRAGIANRTTSFTADELKSVPETE